MSDELIVKYTGLLDTYLTETLASSTLDSGNSKVIDWLGAGSVKVPHITVSGLGKYDRSNGFTAGTMDVAYDLLQLTQDRGNEFSVDAMTDEETAYVRSAEGMREFMKQSVVPQVDAYRFSAYAKGAGTKANGMLTVDTILTALEAAETALGEAGALEGARLYMSYAAYALFKRAIGRTFTGESAIATNVDNFDGIPVQRVRSISFTADPTINDTGYTPGANAINFLVANPMSIQQIKKHEKIRSFAPDINQDKDAWKFQYHLYHDAFVLPHLEDGIYVHTATAIA